MCCVITRLDCLQIGVDGTSSEVYLSFSLRDELEKFPYEVRVSRSHDRIICLPRTLAPIFDNRLVRLLNVGDVKIGTVFGPQRGHRGEDGVPWVFWLFCCLH